MADQKVTDLATTTTLDDTDLVEVVVDVGGTPTNKNITTGNLRAEMQDGILGGVAVDPLGHHMQIQVDPQSGGRQVFGMGSASTVGGSSNGIDADGLWNAMTSAATLNADAGWIAGSGSFAMMRTGFSPIFFAKVKTHSTITELRCWIGLFSANPISSDAPSGHYVGFRFSTVAGDTNWQAVSDDGGAAPTITDTGVAHSVSTVYSLRIDCSDPASIKFYINGSLVATQTTNLPTTTQDLGFLIHVRNTGSTNAKAIKINRMLISTQ